MSPSISPPPPDLVERLLDEHAARFPIKIKIGPLVGDGGVPTYLPVILSNPKPPQTAFSRGIAVALHFQKNEDPTGEELVKECLIWPPRALWKDWRARWAALDSLAGRALALKLGSNLEVFVDPEEGAAPPDGLTPSPRGSWRILQPQGAPDPIHLIVEPPDDEAWRM